jgi:hypothetical protein
MSSLPPGHQENHLVWVYLCLMAPLSYLSFWVPFGRISQSQASCLTVLRPILNRTVPPWLAEKSPLSVFLGRSMYIIHFVLIVYFAFWLKFCFFVQSNLSIQILVLVVFQFSPLVIVQSFFDYCLITVQYSDPENVIQYFDPVKKLPSSTTWSQETSKQVQGSPFCLSIGCLNAYCHHRHELGYTEPISPTGVEEGETLIAYLFQTSIWPILRKIS